MMTIKLSFTILNAWSQKRFDDSIAYYLGKKIPKPLYFELGDVKDSLWNKHAIEKGARHPDLGGKPLINPEIQAKRERLIKFSDEYQILFRGRLDEIEGEENRRVITDWKCGKNDAVDYMSKNSYQLDCYHLLEPKTHLGQYICYNPYTQQTKVGVKYFGEHTIDRALNFILTNAGEFINYAQSQKMLVDYEAL